VESIEEFEKRLGYRFQNKNLLIEALTHKSYKKPYNNERLEFLGDAVLDLVIGEFLFLKFPKADEGELSKMRASLVNEKGFAKLAERVSLGRHIFISNAEENNKGREKPSLLSNAFEATMGAIYLETGLSVVREVVHRLLDEVLGSSGPDHKKEFEVAVCVLGSEYARACGSSKKEAQQEAARIALEIFHRKEKEAKESALKGKSE
jgi:ribonuclease-3